jgi:hypothetical protein
MAAARQSGGVSRRVPFAVSRFAKLLKVSIARGCKDETRKPAAKDAETVFYREEGMANPVNRFTRRRKNWHVIKMQSVAFAAAKA